METKRITIPENSKVSIENGVIIIESNEQKFKRGDILECELFGTIVIFNEYNVDGSINVICNNKTLNNYGWGEKYWKPASEKSKQQLFEYLKSKDKRWNAEKMVVEDVLKVGDLVICWDGEDYKSAGIYVYTGMAGDSISYNTNRVYWEHAVKFEGIEQYKKILKRERKGEIYAWN